MQTEQLRTAWIIHLFALAHFAMALLSRTFHYYDDVPLTVLTISMIAIVSIRYRLQIEVTAILALIACFVGFLLGVYGAYCIYFVTHNDYLSPALATFLVTEALGWSTFLIARRRAQSAAVRIRWSPSTRQIVLTAAVVLLLRIGYRGLLQALDMQQSSIYPEFSRLFSNTFAVVLLVSGNLFFVQLTARGRRLAGASRVAGTILFEAILSAGIALAIYYRLPFGQPQGFDTLAFLRLFAIVLLVDIAVFAVLSLIHYVVVSHNQLRSERNQKHMAQYRYNKLKQQINPHFLFNSLNNLDFLVQEQQTERASAFIRKLAGLYRYLLKNEDEPLVPLSEEMRFVGMYVDLVKERFTDGLSVESDLPGDLRRSVVPCSVQQLVENATKHNIVSPDEPLRIRIRTEGDYLVVENNLQPRLSRRSDSTGLGLQNIKQQYLDIAGRKPVVERTQRTFRVKLPLL